VVEVGEDCPPSLVPLTRLFNTGGGVDVEEPGEAGIPRELVEEGVLVWGGSRRAVVGGPFVIACRGVSEPGLKADLEEDRGAAILMTSRFSENRIRHVTYG
jgi:hypothetical protein